MTNLWRGRGFSSPLMVEDKGEGEIACQSQLGLPDNQYQKVLDRCVRVIIIYNTKIVIPGMFKG